MLRPLRLNALRWVLRVAGVCAAVCTWQMFFWLRVFSPLLIPSPLEVVKATLQGLASGGLLADLLNSLARVSISFALASFVGLGLGLLLGTVDLLYQASKWLIDFFRSLPASALLPSFMLFFGIGAPVAVSVAAFASTLVMITHTVYGIRTCQPRRQQAARLMGASRSQVILHVVLPESLPAVIGGLKICASMSLVLVVVSEMLSGVTTGLGKYIVDQYYVCATERMWGGILVAGLSGVAMNSALSAVSVVFSRWKDSSSEPCG